MSTLPRSPKGGAAPWAAPDAQVGSILVVGSGTWIDATEEKHREHRLVELTVAPDAPGIWVEPAVFHDTYFGIAEGHGIKAPDVLDGRGPDLTDLL
ncbi:hypothetical protein ACWD26_14320 [Streptomyces sp. NPDC002787]